MIWPYFLLITVYGACVGSFLNVVVYRMPRDLSLWHPGSHCPRCQHKLAWYDNLPILGWLFLRGRCRYCALPIHVQYPLVETITLALFALLPLGYYLTDFRITFYHLGLAETWPVLIVHLVLLAGLLGTTLIDARHYIIPLAITWFIVIIALIVLPLAVWYKPQLFLFLTAFPATVQYENPILPATGKNFWNAQIGALIGLGLANVLLLFNILPRSFAPASLAPAQPDGTPNDSTVTATTALMPESSQPATVTPSPMVSDVSAQPVASAPVPGTPLSTALLLIAAILLIPAGLSYTLGGWGILTAMVLLWLAAMVIAIWETPGSPDDPSSSVTNDHAVSPAVTASSNTANVVKVGSSPPVTQPADIHGTPEIWLAHPHPRREVLKEVLFLALPILGALLGHYLLPRGWFSDWQPSTPAPFVFSGVIMGYLVGGAVIWFTRILGTLAFGKEAMGLGDVHLLACIGAVLGPTEAIIIFFLAPVLGLLCIFVSVGISRLARGEVRAIPYGPYLALATIVLMLIRDKLDFLGF